MNFEWHSLYACLTLEAELFPKTRARAIRLLFCPRNTNANSTNSAEHSSLCAMSLMSRYERWTPVAPQRAILKPVLALGKEENLFIPHTTLIIRDAVDEK